MALSDGFSQIMQTLSHVNEDMDKCRSCIPNIDDKLFLFLDNKINSKQEENRVLQYLKGEKTKLLSIGIEYSNYKSKSNSNSNSNSCKPNSKSTTNSRSSSVVCSTPTRLAKNKPKFSSKKKQRPTMKRTPLRMSNLPNVNKHFKSIKSIKSLKIKKNIKNIKNSNIPILHNNTLNKSRIPQKKTLLSLSNLSTLNNANNTNNINNMNNISKKLNFCEREMNTNTNMNMNIDSESENDENVNMNAINFASTSKSMVQMKLEQQKIKKKKQKQKQKPKVDALQRANQKRLNDEKRERERAKKKEMQRLQIAQNKKKKQLLLAEQQKTKKSKQHQHQHPHHTQTKKKANMKKNHNNVRKPLHKSNVRKVPNLRKIAFKIQPNNITHSNNDIDNDISMKETNVAAAIEEYGISDYDSDFSDSDLDEENCGKFIPNWAMKSNPVHAFTRQKPIDPDTIFGRMTYKTCDLEIVFKDYPTRSKYRQRSASGDWSKDQITWTEENAYKKSMGWINRQ